MDLLEFQPLLLFLVAGSALITAVVTGGKYFYDRYISGLNKRIDNAVAIEIKKVTKKLNRLERKVNLLITMLVPARKRELLKNVEVEEDE